MNNFPMDRAVYLYRSGSTDVYRNLAREEYLFDHLPQGSRAFLLYVDSPSVVFGKHQNPWRECSLPMLRERGIPVARRISGGGTVYHDLGNLNFSFILPKAGFDRRANLAIVAAALRRLGLNAEISDRHDIYAGGRKVSGNAFCFRRERALHHGTLLVESKLHDLRGALRGLDGIRTFAVESRPAEVANLAELQPGMTLQMVADAVVSEVAGSWGTSSGPSAHSDKTHAGAFRIGDEAPDGEEIVELDHRNRSSEWLFDRTPRFTIELDLPKGSAGGRSSDARIALTVEKARIESVAEVARSAGKREERRPPSQAYLETLSAALVGLRFDSSEIGDALATIDELAALSGWFRELGL